jgi:hypothetical protein
VLNPEAFGGPILHRASCRRTPWNAQNWNAETGDRRQELVLIGCPLEQAALQHALDACLLTEAEFAAGAQRWKKLRDPWPAWHLDEDHSR